MWKKDFYDFQKSLRRQLNQNFGDLSPRRFKTIDERIGYELDTVQVTQCSYADFLARDKKYERSEQMHDIIKKLPMR